MTFDGIIFDFNGVLWWDTHLQEYAWKQFSEEIRGRPFTDDEIRTHVHGRNNRYTIEYLLGRPVAGEELEHLSEKKEHTYRQLCLEPGADFKLSPGAIDLFEFLESKRIPHTIATASGKENLDFFVAHLKLDQWFDVGQIVYDDGNRPGKPAPDIFQEAANRLGLLSVKCIVVEDSQSGIEAARRAGIGQIIALGPRDTHSRLTSLTGVDKVVESLAEIPKELLF